MVNLAENAGFGLDKMEHNWLEYINITPIYDLDFNSTIVKFLFNDTDNRIDRIIK